MTHEPFTPEQFTVTAAVVGFFTAPVLALVGLYFVGRAVLRRSR